MRNIAYDSEYGLELPKEVQIKRILRVVENELTPRQQAYLTAYYFEELSPSEIARRWGVYPSTVVRTIQRAENRLRRYLKY